MPIHVRSSHVAPIVLLPGDPDRARWIAEQFFENPVCTTTYRQMLGYTGTYRGKPVSVQTTGMGGPSAAIVCEELNMLGAKALVRVGTCGAMNPAMNPGDLLIPMAACMTDSTSREIYAAYMAGSPRQLQTGFAPTNDFAFLSRATQLSCEYNIPYHVGNIASLDRFYGHDEETYRKLEAAGIFAVEMEAATVLTFAAASGLRAACLMTVSDQIYGAKRATESVIEQGVRRMVEVALNAALDAFA